MNKLFIIYLIFFTSFIVSAEDNSQTPMKTIQASKEMPLELNLLLASLQTSISNEKILPLIMNIDSYARSLTKEDIFLIGKIEIYKALLKNNTRFSKAVIDTNTIKILNEAIKKTEDPFSKWFLGALLKDSESLLSTPLYKEYLIQKNNGKLERVDLKKIDKKVQLIFRWISKINTESSDFQESFKAELVPLLMNCVENIEESFFLMASEGGASTPLVQIKSPSELKFFSLQQTKAQKKALPKEKTIDEILAPVTGESSPSEVNLPRPSQEDWTEEDNAPFKIKNLPKPSNDADWLQDF